MKTSSFLIATLALFLSLSSCTKDEDTPESFDPPGMWIGTYTLDQLPAAGAMYYSFIIKPDGNLLTEGVGANGSTYYSKGTWVLVGDSLKCNYTTINFPGPQVSQSAKFHFNSTSRTLSSGTWKDGANGSNYTGTFPAMARIN